MEEAEADPASQATGGMEETVVYTAAAVAVEVQLLMEQPSQEKVEMERLESLS